MKGKQLMKKAILFWIKSSRGTNDKKVYLFDLKTPSSEVKAVLEVWCAAHGAWSKSENVITYGHKEVVIPPRDELKKQYDKACEEKKIATEKWEELAAMMMAKEFGA